MKQYILVQTTIDSQDAAEKIASLLIERKLAACVQIIQPVTSTYIWKESLTTSKEWLVSAKTHSDLYEEVERAIKDTHSYEVPEIIAIDLERVSAEYASWMDAQLT